MKPTTLFILTFGLLFLWGCSSYDYLPAPSGSITGTGNWPQCREANKKTGDLTTTATSVFYVLEVRNKGACPVNVKIELPVGTEIGTKQIPPGSHQVFVQDTAVHKTGDKLRFTLNCTDAEAGNCAFSYKARLCDKIRGRATNPEYTLDPTGEKTIPPDPAVDNHCNNENTPLDLLTIFNNSKTDHTVIFKMKNTGTCAGLHIEPPETVADQNQEKNSAKHTIKSNQQVTFKAYCKGLNTPNPTCKGQILEMKMQPKK